MTQPRVAQPDAIETAPAWCLLLLGMWGLPWIAIVFFGELAVDCWQELARRRAGREEKERQ